MCEAQSISHIDAECASKHLIASEPKFMAFVAESKIDTEEDAAAELHTNTYSGRWMKISQAKVLCAGKHASRIGERHEIEKAAERAPVFGVEHERITIAETILIETADRIDAAHSRQHEERNVGG